MKEWSCPSLGGVFRIKEDDGRFMLLFDEESLGSYPSAEQVLEDLLGGHCLRPSVGYPERFDVPDDLGEWRMRRN